MVIGLVLGLVYTNLVEWLIHRYLLHALGSKPGSSLRFHWEHHRRVRRNHYLDPTYQDRVSHDTLREVGGLFFLFLLHLPLAWVSPWFVVGVFLGTVLYLVVHHFSHMYPEWGKRWTPWHHDHHMGKNQNANWCVTSPLWDWILRTRVKP